jgi:hypothetical protein
MKRNELVDKLVKEGLSEKTLSKLTDNQLNILGERMLQEQMSGPVKGSVQMKKTATNPSDIKRMTDSGVNVTLTEKLKGNQSKIDKNHNGKIDGQDFKILQGQKKKKETNEMLRFYDDDGNPIKDKKGKQSAVSTKDKDFEEKIKSKNIDAKDKKAEVKESVKKKSWVKSLVENEFFHNFTSKGEIMDLIQTKLNENETMVQHGPKVKKGHNGIPEFMSYDVLTAAEPKTAPAKPKTAPGTKPSPGKTPSPKHPYAPGPAEKPEPKAQMRENKKAK